MLTEHHSEGLRAYVSAQHGDLIDQQIVERQQISCMFHPVIAQDFAERFSVFFAEQP